MRDEAGFGDAGEALAALDADRERLRRRARATSRWCFPALSLMIAVSLTGIPLERAVPGVSGFWVSMAALGGILAISLLRRRVVGLAERTSLDGRSIAVVAVMLAVLLGLFMVTTVSERLGLGGAVWAVPALGFAVALLGCALLDRFGELGSPRAR